MSPNKDILPRPGKLLLWLFLDDGDYYQAVGDFEETYRYKVQTGGRARANLWFWFLLFKSFPGFISDSIYWRGVMIKNYLRTALRIVSKQKVFSFISISGLALGMACCFVILIYLTGEMNYDTFHDDYDSIYRLVRKMPDIHGPSTRNPMAPALREDFPEIDLAVRTWLLDDPWTFRVGENGFQQEGIIFADADFFKFFSFEFISGDSDNPLESPFSVVLTKSASQKYFGMEDPIGKTISFDGEFDLNVTAVIENAPNNTHLQFEVVIPMEGFNRIAGYIYGYDASTYRLTDEWTWGMLNTYLKLHKSADPARLEQKFPDFLKKYAPYNKELLDETLYLQPVKDIHLFSQYRSSKDKISDIKFIYVISAIGLVILLMSCFNYINLTTARFSARIREIGIRKVVGAQRKQLVTQFLMESSIFSLIAFILSFALIILFAPVINDILGYNISLDFFSSYSLLALVFSTGLFAALLSGSYPAIFFSGFQPVNIIKDMGKPKTRSGGVRGIFVVFQFSITIVLLASTGLIYKQVRYMKSMDLGYTKEQIVVVPIKDDPVRERYETIKHELTQIPEISKVSFSSALPSKIQRSTTMDLEIDGDRKVFEMSFGTIDYDFFDLYEIDIRQGRNFSKEHPPDLNDSIILNERAVEILNLDNPIGKDLRIFGRNRNVIGVVQDFNFQTLHTEVSPLALRISGGPPYSYAAIKLSTKKIQETLNSIEKTLKKFAPNRAFEYFFFDDYFENLYRTEENFGRTIGYFTLLAIIISSLGLFGLAFFITEQRTKEIGIRKVLGASVPGIAAMLSKDFTKLALLANIVAWPVSYFAMNKWLQHFAYRISIELWTFVLSGVLALFIAVLTVSYQSIKVAASNPADSLRYE
jgi:putative ABC transport system permease protein